jgi:sugar phosphate permease
MRLPFFYGWIIVVVTFVTMGIGVNARTFFSLLLPPITDEFGWSRGLTAGGYSGQSLFLPNWFVRKRGLAVGIAFAGVGIGSITLLPWMQMLIERAGWKTACWTLGLLLLVVLAPINLLLRKRPQDLGLQPDGDAAPAANAERVSNVIDHAWAATEWTLARAIRTQRFWWLALAFFTALYGWYAVQIHQTKYLIEIGFSPSTAAWALGLVSLVGIPGQIWLGHLSDRIGREWIWTAAVLGFAICFASLIALQQAPSLALVYVMVLSQGFLGYGATSVMGAVALELFEGKHFGSIYGTLTLAALAGGAAGPWLTGVIHDRTGSYEAAFWICFLACALSVLAIWMAGPRQIRAVAGQMHRLKQ